MITKQEIQDSKRSELFLINSALNNLEMAWNCQIFQQEDALSQRTSFLMNELRARAFDLRDELNETK